MTRKIWLESLEEVEAAAQALPDSAQLLAGPCLEQFPATEVPNTFRALAEQNVANTRELYEGSKSTLQAVLKSWQKSFGAAGQGAAALNRKLIDLAEHNINSGFDLATGQAGARDFGEVMELQATYWRNLLGQLRVPGSQRRAEPTARRSRRNR